MAERPIKKSERMAAAQSGEGEAVSQEKQDREFNPPAKGKAKKKGGKGRDRQRDDKPSTPVNPALMRGPKPVQAPPPKAEEAATEASAEAESAADEPAADEANSEET
ncbi:MAG: hypothetical protein ACFB8W_14315 [Elainellaceae cyanobacterium]